jgi:catechol-2,3-dioxygenase
MTRIKRVGHVVLYASDPDASAAWYCDTLGMEIVTRSEQFSAVFLSFGTSDHDIALFQAPGAIDHTGLQHVALELDGDLDDLKRFHARLADNAVTIEGVADHGVSYGVYFLDPDGHRVEVFYQRVASDGASKRMMTEIGAIADPVDLADVTDAADKAGS